MNNPRLGLDIVHPDDRAAFEHHRNVHSNGQVGSSGQIDFRIVTAKGETKWISHLCQPVFGKNGEWLGRRGSNRDITERKHVEEARDNLLHQLQVVMETTPTQMAYLDPNFNFLMVNSAYAESSGHSKEALIGHNHFDLFPNDENEAIFRRTVEMGEPVQFYAKPFEYADQPWRGITYWDWSLVPVRDDSGKVLGLVFSLSDVTERIKAEEDLHESEERFRSAFDDSSIAMALTSLDGQLLRVNSAFCRMLLFSELELVGHRFMEFTHPDDVEANLAGLEAVVSGDRQAFQMEKRYIRKDGLAIWGYMSTASVRNAQGKPLYLVTHVQDITERKQAEEKLSKSESRYRAFIALSSEGIWRCEADLPMPISLSEEDQIEYILQHAYVAECNDAYARMYGLTKAEDIIGARSEDIFPRTDQRNIEHLRAFIRSGYRLVDNESHDIDIHGNIHYILNNFTGIVENGYLVRAWGVQRDITQQRLMEQALQKARDELEQRVCERTEELHKANETLKESEERFRRTFDQSPVGAAMVALDYQYLRINPSYCHIMGYSEEELRSRTFFDITHPDDLEIGLEQARCLAAGEIDQYQVDKRYIRKDGKVIWGRLLVGTVKDASGRPLYYIPMIEDITERKMAEIALLDAKEAAEAADRTKSEFLANMSHEIRTPMNAIIGMTSLLLGDQLTPEQRDYLETIRVNGDALLTLINDILDLSKAESGKDELEYQTFNLRSNIEEALDVVEQKAAEKGLDLAYKVSFDTPETIISDPTRLRQVLVNLVGNAVKFTEHGEVEVRVKAHILEDDCCELLFAVKDTGIGIPQEYLGKLFQSFSQADSSITRKYGGTGLGLAISKRLVEMMGGRIWAESVLGQGSTFYFTVKAQEDPGEPRFAVSRSLKESAPGYVQAGRSEADCRSLRILLAEDNSSSQKVALAMLKRLGYLADVAANGIEVLQSLERQPYDLVLMDVQMPEMDGLEATRVIRQRWPNNGPKVIAITAHALDGDRERCLEAGMDDYISKPVQKKDLEAILKKHSGETV